jgi:predicted Rossmann-fold nucleotide-binding protein
MRFAIVGSRDYPDLPRVRRFVEALDRKHDTVVSGGARGVDRMAERAALRVGLRFDPYLPDKARYGVPRAYFERNTLIVDASDAVVAFWDGRSTGTADTILKGLAAGKRTIAIDQDGNRVTDPDLLRSMARLARGR